MQRLAEQLQGELTATTRIDELTALASEGGRELRAWVRAIKEALDQVQDRRDAAQVAMTLCWRELADGARCPDSPSPQTPEGGPDMAAQPENALVVHVFAYPTTALGTGPDDEGVRPLPGAVVTLTTESADPADPPLREESTDAEGMVRFEDLAGAPDYRIAVETPPGYHDAPTDDGVFLEDPAFLNRRIQDLTDNINVRDGGVVVAHVGATPEVGRVTGQITVPDNPDPVGLRVEARSGGRLVDSVTLATGDNGVYELVDIDQPGLVEIRPAASFTADGRTYVPTDGQERRFVLVPPGDTAEFDVEYEPTLAEIQVGAQLVEDSDGHVQRRPLPGVTFRLSRIGDEQPLRELTTQLHTAGVFSGLEADSYRLVAVPPDQHGREAPAAHAATGPRPHVRDLRWPAPRLE